MPEYLSPGVYMEEFEIGARPIEGVSTSTAGFLGETERGPTTPRLITSWLQFQRVYGGYFGNDKYLPGAVDGFFKNGGSRCYIARIVKSGSGASRANSDFNLYDKCTLTVEAVNEGEDGKKVAVRLSQGTGSGFKLEVFKWIDTTRSADDTIYGGTPEETFDDISINEASLSYFEKAVNNRSKIIKISIKKGSDTQSLKKDDPVLLRLDLGNTLKVTNISKEVSGDKAATAVKLSKGTQKGFKLEVFHWKDKNNMPAIDASTDLSSADIKEKFDNLSIDENSSQYFEKAITGTSTLIKVSIQPDKFAITEEKEYLKNGEDGGACTAKLELIFDEKVMTVKAIGEGDWGNRIAAKLSKGTFSGFKLEVFYWKIKPASFFDPSECTKAQPCPAIYEIFDNISINEKSPEYYGKTVNGISNLILVDDVNDSKDKFTGFQYLAGGADGTGDLIYTDYERSEPENDKPGKRKGLTAFKEIEDISIVYSPNAYAVPGLVGSLISHCERLRYRFAILDSLPYLQDVSSSDLDPRSDNPTDFAAFYYPWIKIINPETGTLQSLPPGGYIAGIYARSDTERGVHKAPANEVVQGASDLEFQIMKGEQDVLNPRGVNVIRAFPGRGILVWGARTLSSNTLWKYINVRRLFIYVEASIERGTQWVVFEPNDDSLWARVKATITQFLTGVWRSGALMGTTPEEAFFVKCDRTTMTQDDIDNGRLICIIGIAPVKPAEFVIFRIAQWQGGSAATE